MIHRSLYRRLATQLPYFLVMAAGVSLFSAGCDRGASISPASEGDAAKSIDGRTESDPATAGSPNTLKEASKSGGSTDEVTSREASIPEFYTVAEYSVHADPVEQLAATVKRAKSENKTILLQVGGDWCIWCKRMSEFMATNDSVRSVLESSFLLQKVTYDSENRNEAFLGNFPKISGYPHLFVLDADGNLIHSKNTEELESGNGYSEQAFLRFLEQWRPN